MNLRAACDVRDIPATLLNQPALLQDDFNISRRRIRHFEVFSVHLLPFGAGVCNSNPTASHPSMQRSARVSNARRQAHSTCSACTLPGGGHSLQQAPLSAATHSPSLFFSPSQCFVYREPLFHLLHHSLFRCGWRGRIITESVLRLTRYDVTVTHGRHKCHDQKCCVVYP